MIERSLEIFNKKLRYLKNFSNSFQYLALFNDDPLFRSDQIYKEEGYNQKKKVLFFEENINEMRTFEIPSKWRPSVILFRTTSLIQNEQIGLKKK